MDKGIKTNAGGPNESQVQKVTQRDSDSDSIWEDTIISEDAEGDDGQDWFKASIKIAVKEDEYWSANAIFTRRFGLNCFQILCPSQGLGYTREEAAARIRQYF